MEKEAESFKERLKRLMESKGISQKKLAIRLDVTEATISRYMNTDRIPKSEILANIATALGTTTDYLLYGKNNIREFKTVLARSYQSFSDEEKEELYDFIKKIHNNGGL